MTMEYSGSIHLSEVVDPSRFVLSLTDYFKLLVAVLLCNYITTIARYHLANLGKKDEQLPPTYPTFIPVIGTLIPFLWDNEAFFRRVT